MQQEHFASVLAVRKLESILASTPPPQRAGRILLAGAAEENHTIGQLVFQLLLRRKGWETVDWGANIPLLRLEESLDAVRPQLVVLTAQQLYTAARLQTMANNLVHTGIPVAYAGRAFVHMPELCSRIRGHYLGDTLQQAVEKVETLIPLAPPLAEVSPVSPAYLRALTHFQSKATTIQAHVMSMRDRFETQPSPIEIAGLNLTRSIFAALQLGDIDLVRGEIDWIRGLLHNLEIAESHLVRFFNSYHQMAHQVLGADGQPVLDWLDKTRDELQRAP